MQEGRNGPGAVSGQRTWRGYAQLALVAVALAMALYFARAPRFWQPSGEEAAPDAGSAPPVVDVVVPAATTQALTVRLTGTVSVQETTSVESEVAGRVAWVSPAFTNGGSLAAGETMVRIDPAAFELAVEGAQAAVDAAAARVAIEVAQGLENVRALTLEDPEAEPSAWMRRLPHLTLARAELRQAQAALGLAELRLARTEIALPYDVRVLAAGAAVGEWASPEDIDPATPLGVVYRAGALQVQVPIEPGELAYLDPVLGRAVQVTGPLGSWSGEVTGVSSMVNPTSRLASVFVEFAADEILDALPVPGTFVEVSIEGPAFADVYVLPPVVLQAQNNVWVVRDGELNLFAPQAHGWTDTGWMVRAFDAGEGIVVGPLPGAREGLAVAAQVLPEVN